MCSRRLSLDAGRNLCPYTRTAFPELWGNHYRLPPTNSILLMNGVALLFICSNGIEGSRVMFLAGRDASEPSVPTAPGASSPEAPPTLSQMSKCELVMLPMNSGPKGVSSPHFTTNQLSV